MLKWPLLALIANLGISGAVSFLDCPLTFASDSFSTNTVKFETCNPASLDAEEEPRAGSAENFSSCGISGGTGVDIAPEVLAAATALGGYDAVPDPVCILASQREAIPPNPKQHISYLACHPNPTLPGVRIPFSWSREKGSKPCSSAKHLALVYEDFVESMKCLGLDPGEMFPLFSLESNFEPNLMSSNGYGIGQLTLTGVRAVQLEKLELSKSACAFVRDEFAPLATKANLANPAYTLNGCAAAQPIRNFIYAGLLYRDYRAEATKLVEGVRARLALTRGGVADLTVFLARTMYNGGDAAVRRVFSRTMRRLRAGSLASKDRAAAIKQILARGILEDPRISRRTRKMMARYAFVMMEQAASIEARLNERLGPKVRCFTRIGGAP